MTKIAKRLALAVLVLSLVLMNFCMVFAGSGDLNLVVSTPKDMPKAGADFDVTVSIENNPGFNSCQFALEFDDDEMVCDSITIGSVLKGMTTVTNEEHPLGAMVAAISLNAVSKSGDVAVFHLEALKDIGKFNFKLGKVEICDDEGNRFDYTVSGATVGSSISSGGTSGSGASGGAAAPVKEDPEKEVIKAGTTGAAVTPAQDEAVYLHQFSDIEKHWSKDFVYKAVEKGMFTGYEDGTFRPDANITRGQYVTVLWRMAGSPAVSNDIPFADVKNSAYYADAVKWAYAKGYVNGTSNTEFSPNAELTRQEAMKILFGYSGGNIGAEAMFTSAYDSTYSDSNAIASWAKNAMYWGVYNTLISGTSSDTLSPTGKATRGQLAKILVNYVEEYK